ncbi:unnamed protein product [Colias eurytheme]|nr:unnamed protein product [Colias eurytheme]
MRSVGGRLFVRSDSFAGAGPHRAHYLLYEISSLSGCDYPHSSLYILSIDINCNEDKPGAAEESPCTQRARCGAGCSRSPSHLHGTVNNWATSYRWLSGRTRQTHSKITLIIT